LAWARGTPHPFSAPDRSNLPRKGDHRRQLQRFRPLSISTVRAAASRARTRTTNGGVHCEWLRYETTAKAKDAFFPLGASDDESGRERGWSAPSRQHFEAMCARKAPFDGPSDRRPKKMLMQAMRSAASTHHLPDDTASLETPR